MLAEQAMKVVDYGVQILGGRPGHRVMSDLARHASSRVRKRQIKVRCIRTGGLNDQL